MERGLGRLSLDKLVHHRSHPHKADALRLARCDICTRQPSPKHVHPSQIAVRLGLGPDPAGDKREGTAE